MYYFGVLCFVFTCNILQLTKSADFDLVTVAPIKSRNILELTTEEKREFLDSFDVVFSDIDGVLWNLEHTIEGATDGYKVLQNAGKNVTFITNNSVRTEQGYDNKFRKLGLDVDVKTIIQPSHSVVEYLKSIKFDGLIYIIATETFKNVLRTAGFQLIDGPNRILDESYTDLARNVFDKEPVRAVIIDVDFNLSSAKMIRAHLYLQNPECLLIAGATDMLLPVGKGVSIIGPGPYAKVLTETTGRKAIQLGKPGKELCSMLIERFQINDTRRALMIGDMLEQDIGFGKNCDFQTMLVLSGGCSREEFEKQTDPNLTPDYYAESVADFVSFIKDLN